MIGHLDLDYFYAQVEEVENPSLKARPVAVCVFSGRTDDSGVVSTANYLARGFGVHSGMPIALAKTKLGGKNAAIIRMDHEKYEVVSARIMEELEKAVDLLEPAGIDEAFFDLTASSGGDFAKARQIASSIKESLMNGERLSCSIGLGRSKVVAKLASDMAKPGGLTVVAPEDTEAFLAPLPVSKLYGVGPKTSSALEGMEIGTIGKLAKSSPSVLEARFGMKFGGYLLAAAMGTDSDPVVAGLEPTQFSRILTLKRNTRDPREACGQLAEGIEYVHGKLLSSSKSCKTVTAVAILTDLSTKTKSKTFETPIDDLAMIKEVALILFEELSGAVEKDFRRVGLRVSGLEKTADQTSLTEFTRPAS